MRKPIIKIRDLNYTYPDGTKALAGIDLDIFEAECLGLIGPNGAGKSTLLLHLNGILRGEGLIEVMGKEVKKENLDFIRRKVGLVFQDPEAQLFMPTVFEDVSFGPINLDLEKEKVEERVREALGEVEIEELSSRITHHLSLGEKKRVCIASVLSMRPQLLLLDEPSANLDPRARRDLIALLKRFNHTKIIAGHDLELILEVCTRVVILYKGRVISQGRPQEVLANKELMQTYGLEVPLSLARKDSSV